MSKRILLAPVGSGKTEYVLTHLADALTNTPFAKVWVVLATKRQEDAFRQRLAEWDNKRDVFFNVEFFNFYELYQRILDRQGFPYRLIGEHSRLRILREVIADVERSLKVFHTIVDKPGFLRITADFVAELKQNEINPYLLAKAAQNPKDVDLSIIYTAYQHYINQYDLVDQEGQGWLAVKALREDQNLVADLNLLIVDGFDQFTPVQENLLAL
jgi:ATP-dependent helicase/DNAse subunit B